MRRCKGLTAPRFAAGEALGFVRIAFGLYFIAQAWDKTTRGWLLDGAPLAQFLQNQLPRSEPFYRAFLEGTVLPNVTLVAQLVTVGEWVAGISLTLGLLTRIGSLTGMALVGNYMLMKGLVNIGGSSDRLFFVACLAFAIAGAGMVWGLDGWLRPALDQTPITRWLAGIRPAPYRLPEREEVPAYEPGRAA